MPLTITANPQSPCPCGNQKQLINCCLPYIRGQKQAPTAEALMRSRYSAHVLLSIDYIWDTWHQKQRSKSSKQEIHQWASSCDWLALDILATQAGLENDCEGLVTFVATYHHNGQTLKHHEVSLFKKTHNVWLYIDHYSEI